MSPLKQHPVKNKGLITAVDLSICTFTVACIFFTGCKKEFHHPKEITVHSGSSIQAAVDVAVSGTVIKIEPGTYNEAVVVNKTNITLTGLSGEKRGVFIQNPGGENVGITVYENGDGFILKNVTVSNFKKDGVFLKGVDGFLLSHVTTINNGGYGLFPVHSSNGIIEECTATGHADTGIYVGQSTNIAVNKNEAYANVFGIDIENCTDVVVDKNHSYNNVCGISVVLLPGLQIKKSSDILLTKNEVNDNNHVNFAAPGSGLEADVPVGSGILVVGADNVILKDNNIKDNNAVGIATISSVLLGALAGLPPDAFGDIEPNPDGVKVINNKLVHNGTAPPAGLPLPGVDLLWDGSGTNNCWKSNIFSTSSPSPLPACS